jgi:MFS family permease
MGAGAAGLALPFVNRALNWMVTGLMSSVMTLMIMSKGITLARLGLLSASYSIIIVALEFPSGIISDIVGRKKVFLIALGFSLAARIVLLGSRGFLPVFAGFALYGASRAFSSGSIESLYINRYIEARGKAELHKLMSAMNAGETLGLAAGALLGGVLPIAWDRWYPEANRYDGNLIAQIAIIVILAVLTLATTGREILPERRRVAFLPYVADTLKVVKDTKALPPLIAGACVWGFAFNAVEVFWQPRLKAILGSESQTWIFGLVNGGYFAAALLGVLLFEAISARRPPRPIAAIVALRLASGALIILLSFQGSVAAFAAVYLVMFLFNGAANVPESTALNAEIPEERRSSLLSLSSLAMQLGGVAGSLIFGAAVGVLGIPGVWRIAGAVFGVSGILYLGRARKPRPSTGADR